jgi:hypothetical protein
MLLPLAAKLLEELDETDELDEVPGRVAALEEIAISVSLLGDFDC